PGLGILLTVLATPALVRTMIATNRRKQTGKRITPEAKVLEFVVSLVIVTLVGIAGCIAFLIVCFPTGLGLVMLTESDVGIQVGIGAGAMAAAAVIIWLLWRTRPPRW